MLIRYVRIYLCTFSILSFFFGSYYSGRGKIIATSKLWYQFFFRTILKNLSPTEATTLSRYTLYTEAKLIKNISLVLNMILYRGLIMDK